MTPPRHMLRAGIVETAALLFIISLSAGTSAIVPAAIEDAAQDAFVPVMPGESDYSSYLGQRMKINAVDRLVNHMDKYKLVDAFLKGFEQRPGAQEWCGEYLGKHLHAMTLAWAYSKAPELKTKIDGMARRLIASQTADGYLGTYATSNRWTSWDVWVQKYSMLGLLTYYQHTGDATALAACKKEGDLLISSFGPGKKALNSVGMYWGLPSTSVLEPIDMLYRMTGEAKYLTFARYIVSQIDSSGTRLISQLMNNVGVDKIPDARPDNFNAKSYEMLSNLVGVADFYRLTGEPRYLEACKKAWNDIYTKRHYVIGSSSFLERFKADFSLPGEGVEQYHSGPAEGCVTVTWLQLTWHLFRLTGEIKYADEIERIVYNALIGAQRPCKGFNRLLNDSCIGDVNYGSVLTGVKWYGLVNHYVNDISCCAASLPRGIALIPQMMVGVSAAKPTINLYTPFKGSVPVSVNGTSIDVGIDIATSYPADGMVTITLNPSSPANFTLRLRIPSWCTYSWAAAPGKTLMGTGGQFLEINGDWKTGDQVRLYLYLRPKLLAGGSGQPLGLSYETRVGVRRGPQILAMDTRVTAGLPAGWVGGLVYNMPVAGSATPKVMVPYSDAGQQLTNFSVYQAAFTLDTAKLPAPDAPTPISVIRRSVGASWSPVVFRMGRSPVIDIQSSGPHAITISSASGATIRTFEGTGSASYTWEGMGSGIYFVTADVDGKRLVSKVIGNRLPGHVRVP